MRTAAREGPQGNVSTLLPAFPSIRLKLIVLEWVSSSSYWQELPSWFGGKPSELSGLLYPLAFPLPKRMSFGPVHPSLRITMPRREP